MSKKVIASIFTAAFVLAIAASIFARLTRGDSDVMPLWSTTIFAATFFAVSATVLVSGLFYIFRQFIRTDDEMVPKKTQQEETAGVEMPPQRKRSFGSKPAELANNEMAQTPQPAKPTNALADRANIEYLAASAFDRDFSREAMQKSFEVLHGPNAKLEDRIYEEAVILAEELHKLKRPKTDLVTASLKVPVIFTRYYEPEFKNGLSFFGGRPVGPSGMEWPTVEVKGKTVSLQFMMQWDCRELSAADRTGLLPNGGVLYFFCNTDWGNDLSFRFLHQVSPDDSWSELTLPDIIEPLHGAEGAWQTPYIAWSGLSETERRDYADDTPRVLPKWPLKILPFDYSAAVGSIDDDEDEEDQFWSEGQATKEALLKLQNSWIAAEPRKQQNEPNIFGRPYPAFPQDWAAVRLIAAKVIEEAGQSYSNADIKRHFPSLEDDAVSAMRLKWKAEAKEIYDHARQFSLTARPDQKTRDQIWAWIETTEPLKGYMMNSHIRETIRVSLGLMSAGVEDIAEDWIERVGRYKSVASLTLREEYQHEFVAKNSGELSKEEAEALYAKHKAEHQLSIVRDIFAVTPCRMFGPPSFVQGYIEEYITDHVLLLEISSGHIDGLELAEGVLQFVIRPDDLRQGRFDRVEMVCSAY